MRCIAGWLLDVYANVHNGLSVWLIDSAGISHHLYDDVLPYFFVAGTEKELRCVCEWFSRAPYPVELKRAKRYEVFERREITVLQVRLQRVNDYAMSVKRVAETFPHLRLYHADLTIPQIYFLEKDLFAFAKCEAMVDDKGRIIEIVSKDSVRALDYALPPLRVMTLSLDGDVSRRETMNPKNPAHGYRAPIVVGYDNREYVLPESSPKWMLESLRRHLLLYDPDVILSQYGDSYILGYLMSLERECGVELPLSRDRKMHIRSRRAHDLSTRSPLVIWAAACGYGRRDLV